ncbi:hypothetical protein BDQ17DRAFT_1335920 [Cyathus striatus]|nr:hypothetical protein BDQ17DRAFT_1335920 [Cyathus striatus]
MATQNNHHNSTKEYHILTICKSINTLPKLTAVVTTFTHKAGEQANTSHGKFKDTAYLMRPIGVESTKTVFPSLWGPSLARRVKTLSRLMDGCRRSSRSPRKKVDHDQAVSDIKQSSEHKLLKGNLKRKSKIGYDLNRRSVADHVTEEARRDGTFGNPGNAQAEDVDITSGVGNSIEIVVKTRPLHGSWMSTMPWAHSTGGEGTKDGQRERIIKLKEVEQLCLDMRNDTFNLEVSCRKFGTASATKEPFTRTAIASPLRLKPVVPPVRATLAFATLRAAYQDSLSIPVFVYLMLSVRSGNDAGERTRDTLYEGADDSREVWNSDGACVENDTGMSCGKESLVISQDPAAHCSSSWWSVWKGSRCKSLFHLIRLIEFDYRPFDCVRESLFVLREDEIERLWDSGT